VSTNNNYYYILCMPSDLNYFCLGHDH
jgi:hypothetical protein